MELGDRPVERALAWLFGVLESGSAPRRREIKERFSPGFLDQVGPVKLKLFLGHFASGEPVRIERMNVPSPRAADLDIALGDDRMRVQAAVEPEPPHRFTALLFTNPLEPVANWDELGPALAALDRCGPELSPAVTERIARVRDESQVPGLVAGIVRDGALVHGQALGTGNLARMEPLSMDAMFRTASITKVVTALGIARLVDRGALSFDDPVAEHLNAFRLVPFDAGDPPITIRHVLTHTAGLPRHAEAPGPMPLAELVGGELRAVAPPGKEHVYSNLGFGMLGQVIADITGRSYGDWIAAELLEPLCMTRSLIDPVTKGPVLGYEVIDGRLEPADAGYVADEGAGALSSTLEDLATLATAVCDRDERLCSPATLAELTSSQGERIAAAGASQGLGFVLHDDGRVVWHNGGLNGWASAWYVVPAQRLGVILFATRSSAPLDALARALLDDLLH